MSTETISVLIPLFNEEQSVGTLLERVLTVPLPAGLEREVIVVDDCSTDSSPAIVAAIEKRHPSTVRLIRSELNGGKGDAIHKAISAASGKYSIIQDADLEYDPAEYPRLIAPLISGRADAVFGSRFASCSERRVLYFWHSLANTLLTLACNLVSDLNLTDMETGYKAVRTSLLKSIPLRNNRFGIEPELTIKLAKRRARIFEVPISYQGRTYEEGKKIGLKDAFDALYTILRFAYTTDLYQDKCQRALHVMSHAENFKRWIADTIRPYLGQRVIEIDAGTGDLTRQLSPKRQRYIATASDPDHLTELNRELAHFPNLETLICNVERVSDVSSFREQLESVVCLNVLEHVRDDMQGLRNIHAMLRTGGRAVVLVPEGPQIYGKLDETLGNYRRYSTGELTSKMQQAGFRVETILNFNRAMRPSWYVSGKILQREKISPVELRLFDRLVWLWRRIDGVFPWNSTSLIGIAVKD